MARINKRIALRYARALLDVSLERNIGERVYNDMLMIHRVVENSRDLDLLFRNRVIKNFRKKKIAEAIFQSNVDDLSMTFVNLIIDKNHEEMIRAVISEFLDQYLCYMGIKTAFIETPDTLTESFKKELIDKLADFGKARIMLKEQINTKLIGGYRLQMGDYRYDCSIDQKFKDLAKEFEKNIYEKKY